MRLRLLLALTITAATNTNVFARTIIHVPSDQPTIQAAINAAHNGDWVVVSPGTYLENIDFLGKAITVKSAKSSAHYDPGQQRGRYGQVRQRRTEKFSPEGLHAVGRRTSVDDGRIDSQLVSNCDR
jgi:hypothetical protein